MIDGFLGRDLALAHQLVDERVVVSQAQQLAVAQAVGATVAYMRNSDFLGCDIHRRQGRAHPRVLGVGMRELVDASVCGIGALGEVPLGLGGVPQSLLEHVHRDLRGHLAGLRATHPVGDDEQRRARQQRVLVRAPLQARVGSGVLLGDAEHQNVLLAYAWTRG